MSKVKPVYLLSNSFVFGQPISENEVMKVVGEVQVPDSSKMNLKIKNADTPGASVTSHTCGESCWGTCGGASCGWSNCGTCNGQSDCNSCCHGLG